MASPEDIIALRSNYLTVNSKELRADVLQIAGDTRKAVSPDELHSILKLGRTSILGDLRKNFGDLPASVFTVRLGDDSQTGGSETEVFTPQGRFDGSGSIVNIDEIKSQFHEHWSAILSSGFVPEVRKTSGKSVYGGAWLLLRKPTIQNVITTWYKPWIVLPNRFTHLMDTIASDESGEQQRRIEYFRDLGGRAVDAVYSKPEDRSNAQTALILAEAVLKQKIGNMTSASYAAEDAFDYAYDNPYSPDGAALAIENSQF